MVCKQFQICHSHLSSNVSNLNQYCKDNCLKYRDKRSKPKAEERGKSIVFDNNSRHEVVCYRLDGGVIVTRDISKCDNLILFPDDMQAVFIELKGIDVIQAIKQIDNAISLIGTDISDYDWHGRVVSASGIPRINNNPTFLKLLKLMKKHNINASLTVRENKQTERIPSR